jgi:hypothetical protein
MADWTPEDDGYVLIGEQPGVRVYQRPQAIRDADARADLARARRRGWAAILMACAIGIAIGIALGDLVLVPAR